MKRLQVANSHVSASEPSIVVLGSCFMDYVAYVTRIPQVGETMHSEQFQKGFGGKGANQAVAAGRLGAKVSMVSIVGDDQDGSNYIAELARNGVNTASMFVKPNAASGLAMIFVDTSSSNNEIVICPNATSALTEDFLKKATDNYARFLKPSCRYLICQNEIPLETTLSVMKAAHERGIYTVFNAAPAPSPAEVLKIKPFLRHVSLFCPNEVEAAILTGVNVTGFETAKQAVTKLREMGVRDVVITLGAAGFVIATSGAEPVHVAGIRVKAVDTTGAGDCFVGSMVYYLEKGLSLIEACKKANVCASISVQRKGTQASYPHPHELPQ